MLMVNPGQSSGLDWSMISNRIADEGFSLALIAMINILMKGSVQG